MIIYGQKSKELAHQTLFENCPNCGASNCVELFVLQNYAHVFWIPSFPVGKTGVSQCSNCKKVLKLKEMPADFKSAYQNLKSQTKTPIWTFIGIGAFGVFLFAIWVIGNQEKEKYAAILQTPPQVGDIYEISTKGKNYTLYKVTAVEKDSISVRFNNYEATTYPKLKELKNKGDSAYSDFGATFSKSEIQTMFNEGEIRGIDRK